MDHVEVLTGIAEIATALAGFSGVVVAFGSRSQGSWHPGDRLRLGFLLEASLTAGGFALIALLLLSLQEARLDWRLPSVLWFGYMGLSLWRSHARIAVNERIHGDVDRIANRLTAACFVVLMLLQLINVFWWCQFWPFLAALVLNLAGAAMQFARLIRSAFHDGGQP
jgi:hypothetical protein